MSILDKIGNVLEATSESITGKISTVLNQGQGMFDKFFEPDESGKLRFRDVMREIPESSVKVGKTMADFGRNVFQETARSGGSVGLELSNLIRAPFGGKPITQLSAPFEDGKITFEDAFKSVLFGNDALESLTTRFEKAPQRATEFGKQFGVDQKIVNPITAPFFVGGMVAADFLGGGKPAKKAFEQIAKLKNADEIVSVLKNTFKNIPENSITKLANELTNVTNPKDVAKIVNNIIPSPNALKFADKTLETTRERGFITTMKKSPQTSPEVVAKIASNYNPISNKETLLEARNLVLNNKDEALRLAKDISVPATAKSNAVSQLLIQEFQNKKLWNEAIDMVETTAKRATSQGQAIQALSIWNRLSPEGILRYTQNIIDKANTGLKESKKIKLMPDVAKDITDWAKKIEKMADGEEKAIETAKMLTEIHTILPRNFLKKVSAFQTLAQLLNPKTIVRNIAGNTAFGVLENTKDVLGVAIDSPLSLITGKRTTSLPNILVESKGFKEGLTRGIKDAIYGIDTMGVPSQFDLPKTPIFRGGVGRAAEKILNVVLRAPDRAMYKAAYDGSIYKQIQANFKNTGKLINEPTEAMKEIAHYEGLYRTFQDDSSISQAFSLIKKGLNKMTRSEDFGIGDVVLKYPKTPGNILARGIDYSPVGFIKSLFEMGRPLIGQPFNQKQFVDSFSRALLGTTGLIGTGVLMHRLGLITGKPEKDKDINAVERLTGLGGYKVNVSAIKRFVLSGFDVESAKLKKNDVLYSYDWFQPLAIGVSIGANIDDSEQKRLLISKDKLGDIANVLIESMASGIDTLAEQPLVRSLSNILKYGDASDAIKNIAKQIPQSFVPTLLNQINQFIDNRSRNVFDKDFLHEVFNKVKLKVPGLAQTLPQKFDVFGKEAEVYQNGSNNLFNVFFNPAFRTVYKPTPEAKLVLDLFEQTGEVSQAPRATPKTLKINGKDIKLGPKATMQLQQFIGTQSRWYFNQLANNPEFINLPNESFSVNGKNVKGKVEIMTKALTDIMSAAKIILFGEQPKQTPPVDTLMIIKKYYENPFLPKENKPQSSLINKIFGVQTAEASGISSDENIIKENTPDLIYESKLKNKKPILKTFIGTNYDPYEATQTKSNPDGKGAAGIPIDENMIATSLKKDGATANLRLGTVIFIKSLNKPFLVADLMSKKFNGMNKIDFATPNKGGEINKEYNRNYNDVIILREGKGKKDARDFYNSGEWEKMKKDIAMKSATELPI